MLILFAVSTFTAAGQVRLGVSANFVLLGVSVFFVSLLATGKVASGAAIGNVLALALAMPVVFALMRKALGLSILDVVSALLPPALISSAMTACISAKKVCILPHASALAKVSVLIFVGALFYTGSFALWGRAHLRELLAAIRPILPKPLADRLGQYARLA